MNVLCHVWSAVTCLPIRSEQWQKGQQAAACCGTVVPSSGRSVTWNTRTCIHTHTPTSHGLTSAPKPPHSLIPTSTETEFKPETVWIYPVWTRFFPHNVTVLAALDPHNRINTNTHLCAFTELLCENIFVDTLQECENLSNSVQQGRYQQMRFIFRDAIQEMLQPLAYTYLCSPCFWTLNFRLTCWCILQFMSF